MNFKYLIQHRNIIFNSIIVVFFISFILSYAVANIVLFLLLGFFFIDTKKKIRKKIHLIKQNRLVLIYVLFFSAQLIGYFYSENKIIAARQITLMLPLLFAPAILSVEKLNKQSFNKSLAFLKYAILIIFSYYLFIHVFFDKRIISSFVNFAVNAKLGISQVFMIFILLLPLMEGLRQLERKKRALENTLIVIVSIFFILLMGNKTSVLLLILIAVFSIIRMRKINIKQNFLLIAVFLAMGFIAFKMPIVKNRINVILTTTDFNLKTIITKNKFTVTKNTLEHRILINHLAIKEIKKALPFGVGTGDFQDKLDLQYQRVKFKYALKEQLNNHNQYLSEFLKTGILGGFLFITLCFILLKLSLEDVYFSFPIILLFVLGSCVESYLSRQHGVHVLSFIIPFFLNHKSYLK